LTRDWYSKYYHQIKIKKKNLLEASHIDLPKHVES
jgi:hypothetical protein